jgi:hypothetical protein
MSAIACLQSQLRRFLLNLEPALHLELAMTLQALGAAVLRFESFAGRGIAADAHPHSALIELAFLVPLENTGAEDHAAGWARVKLEEGHCSPNAAITIPAASQG